MNTLRMRGESPCAKHPAASDPLVHGARPLDGVWATAPFLHNGSALSLYQLPLTAPRRDTVFFTGSRRFDPRAVGFETVGGFQVVSASTRRCPATATRATPSAARRELIAYPKTL